MSITYYIMYSLKMYKYNYGKRKAFKIVYLCCIEINKKNIYV